MLETPDKIRELQRKLYQKAKQEKEFRFYLLYDKIYRQDILQHAYELVRSNKGAPGVDGITFEAIQEMEGGVERYLLEIAKELKEKKYKPMPVRRVYIPKADGSRRPLGIPTIKDRVVQMAVKMIIEPIFEADFQDNSYGFRPKRDAHQAMDEVSRQIRKGRTEVIDADITKYFDSIPHDKLMELVAKRIVDKNILKLIKMWLKAPVAEEREDGKKIYKGNEKGTPQGGVISPLLANIYLNVLDTIWKIKKVEERLRGKLIRYADDFVVMCEGNTERIMRGIKRVMEELELKLNEEKTRTVDVRREGIKFLGYKVEAKVGKKGWTFSLIQPSEKAEKRIKDEMRRLTSANMHKLPTEMIIDKLNEKVRGWVGYYYYGNCSKTLAKVKSFLEERVRIYLRRKHRRRSRGYKAYPNSYLYDRLGLYKIPTTAPWTQLAKATGRG